VRAADAIGRVMSGAAAAPSTWGRGKPCETCVHAVPGPELSCGGTGGRYLCAEERSLGWLASLADDACGPGGRFRAERAPDR
jgi:hypothetical protein